MHVAGRVLCPAPRRWRVAKLSLQQGHHRTFAGSLHRAAQPRGPNGPKRGDGQPGDVSEQEAGGPDGAGTDAEAGDSSRERAREALTMSASRGRTARSSRTADAMPQVVLPGWFVREHVCPHGTGSSPPNDDASLMDVPQLPPAAPAGGSPDVAGSHDNERRAMQDYWAAMFEGFSWDKEKLAGATAAIREDGGPAAIQRRGRAICRAASYLLALARSGSADLPSSLGEFSAAGFPFSKESRDGMAADLKSKARSVLVTEADEACGFSGRGSHASERVVYADLRSDVRASMFAAPPKLRPARDLRRPVSVLAITDHAGRSEAVELVNQVARDIGAGVVHLDASSLGDVVGAYLGQTCFWGRGDISMLGYTAAEKSGRAAPRGQPAGDDEQEPAMIFAPASRSPLSKLPGFAARLIGEFHSSETDDKWDGLKMNHILEEIVGACDSKSPAEPLIVHVHNYVELSLTHEGSQILNRLRGIVDRMRQRGRQAVLVGSVASRWESAEMRQKAEELSLGCHFIPYRHSDRTASLLRERKDTGVDNLRNVRAMLSALAGRPMQLDAAGWDRHPDLQQFLSRTLYDIDAVYRVATGMLDHARRRGSLADVCDAQDLLQAARLMRAREESWRDSSTGGAGRPSLPVTAEQDLLPFGSQRADRGGDTPEYNEHEKRLLSGLVDAKSIKTGFDDIVCPAETKESLRALTSLSLIRPEAFLYGVLATERIPGCLLYGPPGTGKTLMARAMARHSGANMLEVSPADLNDKWVGNSEKAVRALFSLARKLAPMVIFLDEADSLLGARHARPGRGGHRETVNQFLREWDGLTDTKAFIMVATNRPFDLDDAVLRRLPRRILLDLPLADGRLQILRVMLRHEVLDPAVRLDDLAAATELYSGSDLKNLCVAAAMEAVKDELRARDAHAGPDPFVFPDRRVLGPAHFAKALAEISASISEDMASLQAIRRFDERYGSSRPRKARRRMGFEAVPGELHSDQARVRPAASPP